MGLLVIKLIIASLDKRRCGAQNSTWRKV